MNDPHPPRPLRPAASAREPAEAAHAADSRPTPVRQVVREAAEESREVTFPGRPFPWKGEEWWAQVLGRTRAGRREDPGVSLLLIGFRPTSGEAPDFSLETLAGAGSLGELSEEELRGLAEQAVPFRQPGDAAAPFFGAADGREGGGARRGDTSQGRRGRRR